MLNERSRKNLVGVHPDLVRVVERAAEISPEPFVVTEGLRNLERQKKLLAAGKSKTLDSRHLTGHAVDLVDADDFKYDEPDMERIAEAMKKAAAIEKVPIEWGPDMWGWDSPHFQLPKNVYPASGLSLATKAKQATVKVATSKPAVAIGTGVATGVTVDAISSTPVPAPSLPAPPDLAPALAWKGFGETLVSLWGFAWQNVLLTGLLLAIIAGLYFLPKVRS
jgi:peptidoglycan L-alanyl-D-glutamate endopeptidase CwlK